jgi:aspartate ammonia-lyase
MRKETDIIGEMLIPEDALYGIHAARARDNFPDHTPFDIEWYKAAGLVKQACYHTYMSFKKAALEKYSLNRLPFHFIDDDLITILADMAGEVAEGNYFDQFIVPAVSGGAGTSINMNINEIITNAALLKMGKNPGDYTFADPIEHANVFQSTNDVIPTSLKIAVMKLLGILEVAINELRFSLEQLEVRHQHDLRIGYTQMQEAVPSSFGKLLSSYNEALSRDWWRVSKCFERIKMVNLGGGATGTGLAVPRFFIMEAIGELRTLTGLPLTRSENLADATSNLDSFVEVHAIIKAHAVNLEKMVSDIRLLASDLCNPFAGQHQVDIPQKQAGSSIMPGKINPVIPEFVISAAHKVYANDLLITSLCAQGCLELNAYLPVIGHVILESIRLLSGADKTLKDNLFNGIKFNTTTTESQLVRSPSITTALIPYIGYHKASELAKIMREAHLDVYEANRQQGLMEEEKLKELLKPENLLSLGYSLSEIAK